MSLHKNNSVLGVVITYRETKMINKAIKSLVNAECNVALVFNGWKETYRHWLDKNDKYIDFKFLNKQNVGFCRVVNQSMKLAIDKNYDFVFLLNNDAWIDEDCISELIKTAINNKRVGLLQPKVYKAWDKKIIDTTGIIFERGDQYSWVKGWGGVINRGENEHDIGQYDNIHNILGCDGCAALYKIKTLKNIGLFWEKLWSMHEVAELAWRAYKQGWKAKFVPTAVAYHWRGYTLKDKKCNKNDPLKKLWDMLGYRNWALTLIRHGNQKQKLFTSAMWMYYGCKSWIGKRIGRNNIGGYYIWLCSLALLHEKYLVMMENAYKKLLQSVK